MAVSINLPGPGTRNRDVAHGAGIAPYKLALGYASVTAFLAAKATGNYNNSTAEAGDWFFDTTCNRTMSYDGTLWHRSRTDGDPNFFRWVPKTQPTANGPAGAAVSGTGQALNAWSVDSLNFQVAPVGTQTILVPILDTTTGYLDLGSQDQTSGDGIQICPSFSGTAAKFGFTTGTSAAFYTSATIKAATVANIIFYVGFKIQAAPAAFSSSTPNYTEHAMIGVIKTVGATGQIKMQTNKASAGAVVTDSTQTATDATALTLSVLCSSAGVWSYKIGGATPTAVPTAVTATAGSYVVPYLAFAQGVAQSACLLQNWECGFQTGAE